jgi:hypothetical protein
LGFLGHFTQFTDWTSNDWTSNDWTSNDPT